MPKVSGINISFVFYLVTRKAEKVIHWSPQEIRQTINNNAHPYSNKTSTTLIINEMIAYYHKTALTKARI